MTNKNLAFNVLFWISVALAIVDLCTTLAVPFNDLLESNILYQWTGGFLFPCIFNIIMFVVFWYGYKSNIHQAFKYYIINDLVLLIFVRLSAIYNAVYYIVTKPSIESVKQYLIENPTAILETQKTLGLLQFGILFTGTVAFLIWYYDYRKSIVAIPFEEMSVKEFNDYQRRKPK